MLVVMYMYMVILCIFMLFDFFFLMIRRPPRSTRTDTLFPYTTLFRSALDHFTAELRGEVKRDNIMVTLFSPGAVATGSIANFDPAVLPGAMGAWLEKGATFDGAVQPDVMGEALAGCFEYQPGVAVEFLDERPNVPPPKPSARGGYDGDPARATR